MTGENTMQTVEDFQRALNLRGVRSQILPTGDLTIIRRDGFRMYVRAHPEGIGVFDYSLNGHRVQQNTMELRSPVWQRPGEVLGIALDFWAEAA